jgi:hypothetical protein
MAGAEKHDDEWPISGEVPSVDPDWLVGPARDQFENTAHNLGGSSLKADHEIATTINEKHVSVLSEHGKEIAVGALLAGLTVAGVFAATRKLRTRRKK